MGQQDKTGTHYDTNYGFPNHQNGIQSGNVTGEHGGGGSPGYSQSAQGQSAHPSGISEASDYSGYRDPGHHRHDASGEFYDPDYHEWRSQQIRELDNDYIHWRQERYRQFTEDFDKWRRGRTGQNNK